MAAAIVRNMRIMTPCADCKLADRNLPARMCDAKAGVCFLVEALNQLVLFTPAKDAG